MIQSGGFISPIAIEEIDAVNPLLLLPPFRMISSLVKLYRKKSENKNPKQIDCNLLVDTGRNMIGKKIKMEI